MSDHYYSENPQSEIKTETNAYEINQDSYLLTTSTGVFSKKGIDFGTRTLLDLFEMPKVEGKVLDLGCGYGPIGLSLGRHHPEREVEMVDINARAVMLSQQNASQNNIQNIQIYQSDGLQEVKTKDFAAIITNPPIRAGKEKIYEMFQMSYEKLKVDGELWIVIQKKQGAPSAQKFLKSLFGMVEVVGKRKGYYVICSKKTKQV